MGTLFLLVTIRSGVALDSRYPGPCAGASRTHVYT